MFALATAAFVTCVGLLLVVLSALRDPKVKALNGRAFIILMICPTYAMWYILYYWVGV